MAADYIIDAIERTVMIGPTGAPVRAKTVTFTTTKSGIVGDVQIPNDQFSDETVAAAVAAEAATLERVKAL